MNLLLRLFTVCAFAFTQVACGFIIESITDLTQGPIKQPGLLDVPISPVYLTALDSYLKAEGACQGYSVIKFEYSSALTPTNTVFGQCINDQVSTNLPVQHGDQAQTFNVSIVGYLENPTTTLPLPPNVTVIYNPPPRLMAGFAVTSGGGSPSGANAMILSSSVGEVVTGTQSSANASSRNGLQGAIVE